MTKLDIEDRKPDIEKKFKSKTARHILKLHEAFPCDKTMDMLECSKKYQETCKVCSEDEYVALEKAFFDKENNLRK